MGQCILQLEGGARGYGVSKLPLLGSHSLRTSEPRRSRSIRALILVSAERPSALIASTSGTTRGLRTPVVLRPTGPFGSDSRFLALGAVPVHVVVECVHECGVQGRAGLTVSELVPRCRLLGPSLLASPRLRLTRLEVLFLRCCFFALAAALPGLRASSTSVGVREMGP